MDDQEAINTIADDFETALGPNAYVHKAYEDRESKANVLKIIDLVFQITIGLIMLLCLFSLMASTTGNILS